MIDYTKPKFKVGDKVRILPRKPGQEKTYPWYTDFMTRFEGQVFTIKTITRPYEFIKFVGMGNDWHPDWLELVDDKPFTQQDLEVGMLVEWLDECEVFSIDDDTEAEVYRHYDEVNKIFKLIDGNYIKIWERKEEKLYTLSLPNNDGLGRFYNQHKSDERVYTFTNATCGQVDWQYHFTQEEINNLPNHKLIKSLEQEEVE